MILLLHLILLYLVLNSMMFRLFVQILSILMKVSCLLRHQFHCLIISMLALTERFPIYGNVKSILMKIVQSIFDIFVNSSVNDISENTFTKKLAKCFLDMNLMAVQSNAILKVLPSHPCFQYLSKDMRTLVHTKISRADCTC